MTKTMTLFSKYVVSRRLHVSIQEGRHELRCPMKRQFWCDSIKRNVMMIGCNFKRVAGKLLSKNDAITLEISIEDICSFFGWTQITVFTTLRKKKQKVKKIILQITKVMKKHFFQTLMVTTFFGTHSHQHNRLKVLVYSMCMYIYNIVMCVQVQRYVMI